MYFAIVCYSCGDFSHMEIVKGAREASNAWENWMQCNPYSDFSCYDRACDKIEIDARTAGYIEALLDFGKDEFALQVLENGVAE